MGAFTFGALLIILLAGYGESQYRNCYYTNWSQYRGGNAAFFPEDVDATLCSHIMFSFADIDGNGHIAPYEWNDQSTDTMVGMYERLNNLKNSHPNLKTLLAVGGWGFGVEKMTLMLATFDTRKNFIDSTIPYLRTWGFDGLDYDFEYPGNRGSPPEDVQRFTMLLQETLVSYINEGQVTGRPRLLMSAAVAAGKATIDTAYEIAAISRELDFINLMSYDLHGSWDPVTGHNAPLFARSGESGGNEFLNVDYAANYWVAGGAPRNKLVIGMPLYGRSFTLTDSGNNGMGSPTSGPGGAGSITGEAGFLAYSEVCQGAMPGATRAYHNEHEVPYLYEGTLWVGYDDPESLTNKVNYLRGQSFAGWMVWAIDLDDFEGNYCGTGSYPLLRALNSA